jgi:hypothetical protein
MADDHDDIEKWIQELAAGRQDRRDREVKRKRDFHREHEAARRAGKMYRNAWRKRR